MPEWPRESVTPAAPAAAAGGADSGQPVEEADLVEVAEVGESEGSVEDFFASEVRDQESEAESVADHPAPDVEAGPEPEADTEPESHPEVESEVESTETEAEPEVEAEPEFEPEAEAEPEADPGSGSEPVTEPVPLVEPEPAPEADPEPRPEERRGPTAPEIIASDPPTPRESDTSADGHLPSHGIGHLAHPSHGAERGSSDLVRVDDYLVRILDSIEELPAYPQPLMETLGLASAEAVRAEVALPGFDNSAMDGYAVRAADCEAAAEGAPVTLPVVGENSAGRTGLLAMSPGTAVKVMTGAPVPTGADAVVPYEWTDRGVARVAVHRAPTPGANIRRAGEDVGIGDLVLAKGAVIGPRQLGLLAGVGRKTVLTRPRPRVVVLSTGSELREPGTGVGRDAIYDANSYLLAAAVRAAGAIAYRVGIVPDEPRAFRDALSDQLVRADLVITSGGVSEGDHDVVKAALSTSGRGDAASRVWFGKVAMQPGKPQGFGVVGEDDTPIFTLPGNPVSSYVSFQTFVLPALRKMMGHTPYVRPTTKAALGVPLSKAPGKRQFVRALYEISSGRPIVTPVGGHGSHLLGDLAISNAFIVLGEKTTRADVGDHVDVLVLDEEF